MTRPRVAGRTDLAIPATSLALVFVAQLGVLVVAAGVAASAGGSVPSSHLLYAPWFEAAGIAAYLTLLGGTIWLARRSGHPREVLGLVRPASWRRAIGLAVAGSVAISIVAALLEPVLHGGRSQGLHVSGYHGSPGQVVGVVLAVISTVLLGPATEEIFFRGAIFACLRPRHGALLTGIVSAVVFGAAHLEPRAFTVLMLLGFVLSGLYEETGSVLPGILLHAANNAVAVAFAFGLG